MTEWRGTPRRYVIAWEISIAISKSVKIPIFYHLYLHIPILLCNIQLVLYSLLNTYSFVSTSISEVFFLFLRLIYLQLLQFLCWILMIRFEHTVLSWTTSILSVVWEVSHLLANSAVWVFALYLQTLIDCRSKRIQKILLK